MGEKVLSPAQATRWTALKSGTDADSDDILVSFTALKDGKAVPIAGVYVEKQRTGPKSITVH